jgi:CelD/BcsL family acetyltransferase involved in cellulose biosynthesis
LVDFAWSMNLDTPIEVLGSSHRGSPVQAVRLGIEDPRWQEMVEHHPEASAFHTATWCKLLADCYGVSPFLVAVQDEEQRILAGLPMVEISSPLTGRRWKSLPFTDYVPVLSTTDEAARTLLDHLIRWRQQGVAPDIKLRGPIVDSPFAHGDHDHVHHLVDLSRGPDDLWSSFDKSVRKAVRVAERAEVRVEFDTSLDGMLRLYDLEIKTRRRLGVPPRPRRFFEMIWERFIAPGAGCLLLAYRENKPIAGGARLIHNKRLSAVLAASDTAYWGIRPNNAIDWTTIRWGCEQGFGVFDWGMCDASNLGLRAFKNDHSALEMPLVYTTVSLRPPRAGSGKMKNLAFTIIRHAPVWMVRQTGELLLRHFA